MDTNGGHRSAAYDRLRGLEIRRSRYGCSQVSICLLSGYLPTNVWSRSLRPLVIALAPGQQKYLDQIKDMRIHLANELGEIISEYGPKLYDDFNEVIIKMIRLGTVGLLPAAQTRILVPSASVPPSYNQGLQRRKPRDPQGRLLNHPMVSLSIYYESHTNLYLTSYPELAGRTSVRMEPSVPR